MAESRSMLYRLLLDPQTPRGLRVILWSPAVWLASVLPLLVYLLLGPEDGNPLGLGLLSLFGTGLAVLMALAGLLLLAFDNRKRNNPD